MKTAGVVEQFKLSPLECYTMLIAAAIHDYDHNGLNNNWLADSMHPLAIQHNNESVLESHHLASAYTNCILPEETNPFHDMPTETLLSLRNIIIDIVKATDVARYHGVLVNELTEFLAQERTGQHENGYKLKDRIFVMKMVVKCADISNPARPQHM